MARLAPLSLPASARVRLRRLRPEALYKEGTGQITVPLAADEAPVETVTSLLRALVPDGVMPPAPRARQPVGTANAAAATRLRLPPAGSMPVS